MKKIVLQDQVIQELLGEYNYALEQGLDESIEDEQWYMRMPLFESIEVRKSPLNACIPGPMKLDGRYEAFFFGKNAQIINSAEQLSLYRGTFTNFANASDLDGYNVTSSLIDDISLDPQLRSV